MKIITEETRKCYIEGKYLSNPLRISFPKLVLSYTIAFKFILKLVRRCYIKKNRNNFKDILEKYIKRTETSVSYNLISTSSLAQIRETEGVQLALSFLDKATEPEVREYPEAGITLSTTEDKLIPRTEISSWLQYPGFLHVYGSIRQIKEMMEASPIRDKSRSDKVELISLISNVHKYIKAYGKERFTAQATDVLKQEFHKVLYNLRGEAREFLKITAEEIIKDPAALLNDKASEATKEMLEWLIARDIVLPPEVNDYSPAGNRRIAPYEPRLLLSKIYSSSAEYNWLCLLVWEHLHSVLTREIEGTWSKEKINRYGKYVTGNKLISNRQFVTGIEVAKAELQEEGYDVRKLPSEWPSLTPLASKHSPIVLALILHIHHDEGLNPLNRAKLPNHRGSFLINAQLLKYLQAPGVLDTIQRVRDACQMCQVRLKRRYQPSMAPLPEATFILNPGFLIVGIDFKGPYHCKILKDARDTQQWKYTTLYTGGSLPHHKRSRTRTV